MFVKFFGVMDIKMRRNIGRRRNLLLKYQKIMEEFDRYDCRDVPIAVIHRKYIYPQFYISRNTLYVIFNTDIDGELEKLKEIAKEDTQLSIF